MNETLKAILEVISGKMKGQKFLISEETSIGRASDSKIFLPDPLVSRNHAKIYCFKNFFFVEDLLSHNGTFVNEKRIKGEFQLKPGDILKIGSTEFLFKIEDQEEKIQKDVYLKKKVDEFKIKSLRDTSTEILFESLDFPTEEKDIRKDIRKISQLILKAKNFAILYEIAKSVQEHLTYQSLIEDLSNLIVKVLDANILATYIINPENHNIELTVEKVIKAPAQEFGGISPKPSKTLIELVIKNRQAIISSNIGLDERFKTSESIYMMKISSLLAVPSIYRDKIFGVIALLNYEEGKKFREEEMDFLIVVANLMAVSLQNIRLFEEQKRTIEELIQTKEDLIQTHNELLRSEKIALIGKFSSGIIHEVKNLLSPLLMGTILLKKYPDNEDIKIYMESLQKSYTMIISLLNELKTFATGSEYMEESEEKSVVEVIDNIIYFLRLDPDVRDIEIIKEIKFSPVLKLYPKRLSLVLINLIRNASKAVKWKEDGFVKIEVDREDGCVCISITDNGIGIDEEIKQKIWEPFFSTTDGIGLGLYMCKKMVQTMGGSIFLKSKKGEGSTFEIKLPLEKKS